MNSSGLMQMMLTMWMNEKGKSIFSACKQSSIIVVEVDMLKSIPNLPENALGFSAHGAVTGSDYENVLIPAVEKKLLKFPKIRFLYQMGEDFTGYDAAAMWDDAKIGLKHPLSWERCAVVTDVEWIRIATKAFGFIFPGEFRLFHNHEFQAAFDWISE